ncbi:MAG: GNAT family N-acetyltransferase [Oscillospiraceae bacterium]
MDRKAYATDGEYVLYPIADEDRDFYVELHRQINGESSFFLNPYLKDMMWKNVLTGGDEFYSIYEITGDYCGSFEIQNPCSDTPEIGIDLLETKRNKGIAPRVVKMFLNSPNNVRNVSHYLIKILSGNIHSRHVFEKMGAVFIGTEDSFEVKLMNVMEQVMDNDKLQDIKNMLNEDREKAENDTETVFRYKLMP